MIKLPHRSTARVTFSDGACLDILGEHRDEYIIRFNDLTTGRNVYTAKIGPGCFAAPHARHYAKSAQSSVYNLLESNINGANLR